MISHSCGRLTPTVYHLRDLAFLSIVHSFTTCFTPELQSGRVPHLHNGVEGRPWRPMEAEAENGVNDNIISLSQGPAFSNVLGRKECNL